VRRNDDATLTEAGNKKHIAGKPVRIFLVTIFSYCITGKKNYCANEILTLKPALVLVIGAEVEILGMVLR
jgi:hypothetical protein